jgi:hypothetical protein
MHSDENRCFHALTNQNQLSARHENCVRPTSVINRRFALEWHLAVYVGSREGRRAPESETL